MSRITLKTQHFIGCLVLTTLLIATQVSALGPGSLLIQTVSANGRTDQYSLHLEAVFTEKALIGQVTVSDKNGRPWTDVRGQAYLLDSSGQRVSITPLHLLGPGKFRLIASLSRLNTTGYLDIQLPGQAKTDRRRGVFQVDRASRTVAWVENGPVSDALSHRASGGPDAFGYTWDDTAAYEWVDTAGAVSVPLRDDDWAGPFDIGFTFRFYGESHSQFYLDSNGYIGFDSTQTESYYGNSRLPLPHRPNNIIAPFWDDLDPSQGGAVRYRTLGKSPSRYLVVEWNSVPLYGTSDEQSFQLILYESNNSIKFQYPATRQGAGGDLRYATPGIENGDGTIGLEYPDSVPIGVTLAVRFNFSRPAYNVFLTPDRQGSPAAAGSAATFHVSVKNLGAQADSYTMNRATFTGSDWEVRFYDTDGITPLPGNSTGAIAAGSQKDIVAQVAIPAWAAVGNWSRATVRATSQGNGLVHSTTVIDAMLTPSFYQVYTDDDSGDGTEDLEYYVEAVVDGSVHTRRLTTDQDNSSYSGIAATPDGHAITLWNTDYWNSNSVWVSDIQYAIVDRFGNLVRAVTRLTDNSAATQTVYDFSPTVAVAPNGNTIIGWNRQADTYNVWYSIVGGEGATVQAPAAFTSSTSSYPRNNPPSVAALAGGNFLLTWEREVTSSGPVDIYYAMLDNNGDIVRSETRLTDGAGFNVAPRAASLPDGKTAIVWTCYNSYRNSEICYRVLNADGTPATALIPVTFNGGSGNGSIHSDIVALSDGRLAIAWEQFPPNANDWQIQYTIVSGSNTGVSEDLGSIPGTARVIYTVPNAVTHENDFVSLAVDDSDRLIMTWLHDPQGLYLLYALASNSGPILTPATILQRTRHSYLWSSWKGYGIAPMPTPNDLHPVKAYLPVVLKDNPPPELEVVTNGTFEDSFLGWTVGGDSGLAPRVVTSQAHSDGHAAVVGQENAPCESGQGGQVGQSWIYQNVAVPSNGSPQLTFYYRILTYDKVNADKYDRFEVYVNGTLLSRLGNTDLSHYGCSKDINNLGWRPFTYDLSNYRGQTVQLRLVNITHPDDWFGTWTYVDDISIK